MKIKCHDCKRFGNYKYLDDYGYCKRLDICPNSPFNNLEDYNEEELQELYRLRHKREPRQISNEPLFSV